MGVAMVDTNQLATYLSVTCTRTFGKKQYPAKYTYRFTIVLANSSGKGWLCRHRMVWSNPIGFQSMHTSLYLRYILTPIHSTNNSHPSSLGFCTCCAVLRNSSSVNRPVVAEHSGGVGEAEAICMLDKSPYDRMRTRLSSGSSLVYYHVHDLHMG